jgi:hypothetical protein
MTTSADTGFGFQKGKGTSRGLYQNSQTLTHAGVSIESATALCPADEATNALSTAPKIIAGNPNGGIDLTTSLRLASGICAIC